MNMLASRLYKWWLIFLRYANTIDLHAARLSGNTNELVWCRLRISDLDRQIDNISISML